MFPYEGTEAEVTVEPGASEILILKRTDADAYLRCNFISKMKKTNEELIEEALK